MLSLISFPVHPRVGGISPHGVGIAVGFTLGGMLMTRYAERKGISKDHVWNMLMAAVFGVIIGARLFYVVGHLKDYIPHDVLGIFKVWQGGLVFYGGVFGGILAAVPYARKHNLTFWKVLDAAAPGFPLGLIFGRIGDLIVGDHLGGPTTLPWAFRASKGLPVSVPLAPQCLPAFAQISHQPNLGCHPTALYDLVNVLLILPIVLLLARRERPKGFMIITTATLYGVGRFFVDFGRSGTATYLGLRGTQYLSLVLILMGIWYALRRSKMSLEDEPIEIDAEGAYVSSGDATDVDPAHGPNDATPPAWQPPEPPDPA